MPPTSASVASALADDNAAVVGSGRAAVELVSGAAAVESVVVAEEEELVELTAAPLEISIVPEDSNGAAAVPEAVAAPDDATTVAAAPGWDAAGSPPCATAGASLPARVSPLEIGLGETVWLTVTFAGVEAPAAGALLDSPGCATAGASTEPDGDEMLGWGASSPTLAVPVRETD